MLRRSGDWVLINQGAYTNPINITVDCSTSNDLQLYSDISPSSTTFVQGQPASVNVNIINNGSNTFYGQYHMQLYDMQSNVAQAISVISETNGLPPDSYYLSPLTFSTSAITVVPGTYFLGIGEEATNDNTWYWISCSSFYNNPVLINVVAPTLSPDIYEPDNTETTPYVFPVVFSNNSASINTTGSNIHIDTDQDYYQINLASGNNYVITARVYDSYNPGNPYTCDVIWSYNINGGTWSDTYDDIMSDNITVNNGGYVTFHVSPYLQGMTGTYLLSININRITGINELSDNNNLFEIYPNPATDKITIETNNQIESYNLEILNTLGQVVLNKKIANSIEQVDLSGQAAGVYFVKVQTGNNTIVKKIIKQ